MRTTPARAARPRRPAARRTRPPPRRRWPAARRSCGPRRTRGRAAPPPRASSAAPAGCSATAASASAHGPRPVPVDQQPGPAVGHRDRQPADPGGHHRGAAGLRLQRDQPERLVVAGHRDHVRRPVHRRTSPAPACGGRKRSTSVSPSAAPSCCSAVGSASPLPDGPPATSTTSRARSAGSRRSSSAAACSSTSGAFSGWMRPTKASTTASGAMPSAGPGGGPVAGPEPVQVDAGRDGDGARGVGAVELDELAGLLLGVADQPVGLGDHLVLADHPDHRLRRVARRPARRS